MNQATATHATKQQATGQTALTGTSRLGLTSPLVPAAAEERYPANNPGKESR